MTSKTWTTLVPTVLVLALAGCSEKAVVDPQQQMGKQPVLPAAKNFLVPPMQVPEGVGWQADGHPTVVSGLKIEKIADGLMHPRQLTTLPNGDVLVVESNGPGTEAVTTPKQLIAGMIKGRSGKGAKGGNRITLLRKQPGSGKWEQHVFLEHLHSPFGVQLIGQVLYVANTDRIMKYAYTEGATSITDPGSELADLPDTINHHWTKALLASRDGKKLYVGVGSNSNITENGLAVEYRRADILEVDVATGASRVFASGLRNPTGLQWEPQSGKLWTIVNERDEIGADLVPDYMTAVQEGGFYGWPYSYYGQNVDQRVQPQRPDLVQKAIKPDFALTSHVAPLGLLFYTGANLPAQYRGGAFISEHGSWDRSPLSGYEVSFVKFVDGRPTGQKVPVVTGFASPDEKSLYGAPVGLAQSADGALLIADDVGN
jgi:glucose/arabinose dehydrogenase